MADESLFDAGGSRVGGGLPEGTVSPPVATYELRPLTTGEILDRTFYLYRSDFCLFVGLAAIAAGVSVVTSIARLLAAHYVNTGPKITPLQTGVSVGIGLVAGLLYLVVYSVTHAATVSAVTSIYLGEGTSLKSAFQSVMGRWARYFGIALWQSWSMMWLFAVLMIPAVAGFAYLRVKGDSPGTMVLLGFAMFAIAVGSLVYGLIAYIRNSLAVPAEVMEGLTVRAAMRRSKVLAAGTKGRIFLLLLFVMALYLVAAMVQIPLTMMIAKTKSYELYLLQAAVLFVNFVVASVVAPVGAVGVCLFYIDQRVRKEGFDIEFLLHKSAPGLQEIAVEAPAVETI